MKMNRSIVSDVKPDEAQWEQLNEFGQSQQTPAFNLWLRLRKLVRSLEQKIDEEHELVFVFTSVGRYYVENITYWSPDLMIFDCYIDDSKRQQIILVQHYSQVNFQIVTQHKSNTTKPVKRIGFIVREDDENSRNQPQ